MRIGPAASHLADSHETAGRSRVIAAFNVQPSLRDFGRNELPPSDDSLYVFSVVAQTFQSAVSQVFQPAKRGKVRARWGIRTGCRLESRRYSRQECLRYTKHIRSPRLPSKPRSARNHANALRLAHKTLKCPSFSLHKINSKKPLDT